MTEHNLSLESVVLKVTLACSSRQILNKQPQAEFFPWHRSARSIDVLDSALVLVFESSKEKTKKGGRDR